MIDVVSRSWLSGNGLGYMGRRSIAPRADVWG